MALHRLTDIWYTEREATSRKQQAADGKPEATSVNGGPEATSGNGRPEVTVRGRRAGGGVSK